MCYNISVHLKGTSRKGKTVEEQNTKTTEVVTSEQNAPVKIDDPYKTSRLLYIIEAALEYFVAILVADTYLTKIATSIGISNTGIGILSAFVALGNSFQIFAIFLSQKKGVKKRTIWLGLLNQLLFSFIYIVPLFPSDFALSIPMFVGALLLGQIIMNVINPGKINWYMSLVPDKTRGVFTANKEIVSLLSGIVVTLSMGRVIDYFEEKGEIKTAFLLVGITLLVLTVLHTLTLVFSKEKPQEENAPEVNTKEVLVSLFKNKTLYRVIGVSVIWAMINYATLPFYGPYRINILCFSMTFNAVLTMISSITRACFSRTMGRFADKYSFKKLLILCYTIKIAAFFCAMLAVPDNGKVLFTLYSIFSAIAMAGINSSEINLIYDYVEPAQRTGALAIKYMISGVVGFLTTLLMTIPMDMIEQNGNMLFGLHVYPQQFASALGVVGVILLLMYVKFVVKDKKASN